MKVIDLLNKIAKEEEVPKKIKWCGENFTFNNNDCNFLYKYQIGKCQLFGCCKLNDEIEIIEDTEDTPKEDKKIKRIQSCGDNLYSEYIGQWLVHKENYSEYDELLMNKINEIIDRLNGEDNEDNN